MEGLKKDTSAQWIMLSGFTVSLTLIAVAILINQATITGYHSSNTALDFPKEQIRELVTETKKASEKSADLAWQLNHTSNDSVLENFTSLINSYDSQASTIYASHGETIDIEIAGFSRENNSTYIDSVWLNISYNDGKTYYSSKPEIVEVK